MTKMNSGDASFADVYDAPLLSGQSNLHLEDTYETRLEAASDWSRDDDILQPALAPGIANRIYVSHFLSTWNSRVFEFGAVLYLATIFANTLMPMSLYALTRGISAAIFSPTVGRYVDAGSRLQVVRLSIGESCYQ